MSPRILIAASVLLLAGCGFHPLYGVTDGGVGAGQTLRSIYVEPVPERVGYELRNDLLDLLDAAGEQGNSAYRLKLILHEEPPQGVALQQDATITRYNYRLTVHYELFARDGTQPVKSGDVSALTAYNVASSPYATVVAERDAGERAANDIAGRIRTELAVYFHEAAGGLTP